MEYKVVVQGTDAKRACYPLDQNVLEIIREKKDLDWYDSIYIYSEDHKKKIDKEGASGIKDVTTNRIVWDFDSATDLNKAKEDTQALCNKLVDSGIDPDSIDIAFSGGKGFAVVLYTNGRFSPDEARNINLALAGDLKTNDTKIAGDAQRIFRIVGTKHNKSGLFKTSLSFEELNTLSVTQIQKLAETWTAPAPIMYSPLPKNIEDLKVSKPKLETKNFTNESLDIDYVHKPKGWSNCKWALRHGYGIREGSRHEKLLCVIATSKALHEPKEGAYYNAKLAYENGLKIYGGEKPSNDQWKDEIWRDVESVYDMGWKGGTYSCKDGKSPWLTELCESLGIHKCKHNDETSIVTSEEVFDLFSKYAENYENNILTTGITPLDAETKFLVGTSNGILAPPGVGKTSMSLSMLNHNSYNKINSIFFSYDMYHSMVYIRLVQKHFGLSQERIFDIFKHDKKQVEKWKHALKEQYNRVKFCFKSGQSADEIEQTIVETEDNIGDKVKLIVVDYNELVVAKATDPTQASAETAQRFRQIANDREVCVVTLLQPVKNNSDPADEASTYQAAKGSGAIAQSMTLMLGLSRPGYGDKKTDDYFNIKALKNRNGPPFNIDLGWNGLTGSFSQLSPEQEQHLAQIRVARSEAKKTNNPYN